MPAGAIGGRQTSVMGAATNEIQEDSGTGQSETLIPKPCTPNSAPYTLNPEL
jgi:hypothetical protein